MVPPGSGGLTVEDASPMPQTNALFRSVVDAQKVAEVLSRIAALASETMELQEVFDRVAAAAGELIAFDTMGVVRAIDAERAAIHACTFPCQDRQSDRPNIIPMTAWSPRLRPRPAPSPRIEDALVEFDPDFPFDAQALRGGVRSGLWEPFRMGASHWGGVWLAAGRPYAFTDEDQELLRPIAALLGAAVEHWRIWDAERRRRTRLEQLETLFATLAESLDVREVFTRLSDEVKPILPHDLLALTELDVASQSFRVVALAGVADAAAPAVPLSLTPEEATSRAHEFELVKDIQADLLPNTERDRLLLASGMRAFLRVPVLLSGRTQGSLGFLHRRPDVYEREDVEIGARLADRVALMLSHHRLAEEARAAAEAQERAERLEATVATLASQLESGNRGPVVGVSRSWKETLLAVRQVAASDTTVLITGESGTGKEVISSLIHRGSPRADRPFVAINCAALPEQLLETELFGHEKGAFTGAIATKIGRIEQAAGGTLFLDEIAEMSPLVQAKFLRFLEEREFQRLGGTRTLKADVRVIAATHRDLAEAIRTGSFRQDLFYRLNVFQIPIAPLRERRPDVLPLAEAFLEDLGRTMGRPAAGISRDAREWLLAYNWPGNVRELRNAIERAILLCDGGLITRSHLPAIAAPGEARAPAVAAAPPADSAPIPPGGVDLEAMEREFVLKALQQAKGNKSRAARLLNLTRAQLYTRLEKYNLTRNK